MDAELRRCFDDAAKLADRYNWPWQARQLRNGVLPEGFGPEVGREIALFLAPCPIFTGSAEKLKAEKMENRAHAKQMAELRYLLAKIAIKLRDS